MRGGLPDEHPASQDDAGVAGARFRRAEVRRFASGSRSRCGHTLRSVRFSTMRSRARSCGCSPGVQVAADASRDCRSANPGRGRATFRRRKARPSTGSTPGPSGAHRHELPEDAGVTDARSRIFARIRAALDVDPEDQSGHSSRRRPAQATSARHHPVARAHVTASRRSRQFADMLDQARRRFEPRRHAKKAVGAIGSYLGSNNLPPRLRMGADAVLASLPWKEAWDIERSFGPASPQTGPRCRAPS